MILVTGCGAAPPGADGPVERAVRRTSIAVDYASFYAPIDDVKRLATAHAAAKGLRVTFSTDSAGAAAQTASLKTLTGPTSGFGVVAVAPFDVTAANRAIGAAKANGVKVVGYLDALAGQAAGVSVNVTGAATQLATDVAAGRERSPSPKPRKRYLVLVPPSISPVPDPVAGVGRAGSKALLDALRTIGVLAPSTATALGEADAEQAVKAAAAATPGIDTVLTWNDATAVGAAKALGRRGSVGALALGGVSSAATLRQLRRGDTALQEIVAPRLADLADALIDVPANVLAGRTPASVTVEAQRFTPGAAATRAALADYAG
ncbi:MAG: substrate-binding domain-containing protein [Solirubrobacteraceae bacterium]